jgi:hypothetical protein
MGKGEPSLEEIKKAAEELKRKWARELPRRAVAAKEAAEERDKKTVDLAIMFHMQTGMYPWEVPESAEQASQREWLASSGIMANPEELRARIEYIKSRIEARKKD